jgi:hypothetical protein
MKTEFTINVPGIGDVDVVRQSYSDEASGRESFWDLFDATGTCLNEGDPFWKKPTRKEVAEFCSLL